MTTLAYFDPWLINYNQSVVNPVRRTESIGYKRQAKSSHREIVRASASRILRGAQVPYLEYFIREVADGGKFTDYYSDGEGVQQGEIRIAGGYTITAGPGYFTLDCNIEIFR